MTLQKFIGGQVKGEPDKRIGPIELDDEMYEFLRWVFRNRNEKYESIDDLIVDILDFYRTKFWEEGALLDNKEGGKNG